MFLKLESDAKERGDYRINIKIKSKGVKYVKK